MSDTVLHPRAFQRGVANARVIVRSEPGQYTDDEIVNACDFMMAFGDGDDYLVGHEVMKVVNKRTIDEASKKMIKRMSWLAFRDALIVTVSIWIAALVLFALVTM